MDESRLPAGARERALYRLASPLQALRDAMSTVRSELAALRANERTSEEQIAAVEQTLGDLELLYQRLARDIQALMDRTPNPN